MSLKTLLIAICCAFPMLLPGCADPPRPPSPPPPPVAGKWLLLWADEFDGPSLNPAWKAQIWKRNYRGPVELSGGQLHMSAADLTTPALVSTNQGFSFRYGYVEARMRIPKGQGIFPAFWMMPMPASGANDDHGEIDIMEALGDSPRTSVATYHWKERQNGTDYDARVDLSQDFHVYAVDWRADRITWYFDGKPIKTLTANEAPIVADPMYLILDVWLGGWHGPPDATTPFPATLHVDYVRVWQKAG
jgi:hypothetical protein